MILMKCMTDCLIASAFIGASALVMFRDSKSPTYKKLYNSLSKEKKDAYVKIKKERMFIMLKATLFGIFVSITFSKFENYLFPTGSPFNKSCINTLIFFGVQYMFYMLHPKSDYMLNHIDNNEQAKQWLEKYKFMQRKWHIGLLLGIVGYFFVNLVIFKEKENPTEDFKSKLIDAIQGQSLGNIKFI